MKKVIWNIIITLLFVVGISLLFYPKIQTYFSLKSQQKEVEIFKELEKQSNPNLEKKKKKQQKKLEQTTDLVGILTIDSIDLEIGILNGTSNYALKKGLGIVDPKKNWETQNVSIAGHRAYSYGKQFNRMNEVKNGDKIEIKTMTSTYIYQVTDKFIVHKSQVEVLEDGEKPTLTLITCHPLRKKNPPNRLIVKATLIDITNNVERSSHGTITK